MTLAPTSATGPRQRYRPPIGIPNTRQSSTGSAIASVLVHALIILLIIGPVLMHELVVAENRGAGGKGPSGGGGGGNRGGAEKVSFIEVAPPPPPPVQKQALPSVVPPLVKPPEPQPEPPKPDPVPVATPSPVANGVGTGGAGSDGGKGNGPGTGGGVGAGEGTGRGSGNGPGTGGGTGRIYPPYVTNLALLPMPVPSRVRPYTLTAVFEVDEKGNAKLLHFNESKDGDYNKKIRLMLHEIRFRPATRSDGTPVRDTTSIVAEAKL